MSKIAYTSIIDGPKDGKHFRLVVADESGGYMELKETGAPEDPFYVAKGPIWFDTRMEAEEEAARRNTHELGLSFAEAQTITFSSVAHTNMRGPKGVSL